MITRWSWDLIREISAVLLDRTQDDAELPDEIRKMLETGTDRIADLHVWRIGPGPHAAIISMVSSDPKSPSDYKACLGRIHGLFHITVEVKQASTRR